jgi:plasmid stabilization system protein ParE
MPAELVIAPEAESDIAESYAWYDDRRVGLGEEFLSSVDACIESIRRRPEMYRVTHEGQPSRLNTAAFSMPCSTSTLGATVTIYALFHTSRDPDKWRQRFR